MIKSVLAAALIAAALAQHARADLPDPGHACSGKAEIISAAHKNPAAIVTDIAGPLEEILILNLIRYEARDFLGADLVITRWRGQGYARISVIRSGCLDREIYIDNLYLAALLRVPKEEGV